MNILIVDVAASQGGALTVLNQFYNEFSLDNTNTYYICVSTPILKEQDNIKLLQFPWVKKSWIHRLYFELFIVKQLINIYQVDRIFSLQNLILINPKCEKWIFMHQSLPFSEVKFSAFSDPKLWVYQNIIGKLICCSIKNADKIIVQTKWVREACVKYTGVSRLKFELRFTDMQQKKYPHYTATDASKLLLFYPAISQKYKNQMILLKALRILKLENRLGKCQLILTISGEENGYARQLKRYVNLFSLPVSFVGFLDQETVMDIYTKSILVFPSYIESLGIPLQEAQIVGCPIIAADCPYSREILESQDAAGFFNPFDAESLANEIYKIIS